VKGSGLSGFFWVCFYGDRKRFSSSSSSSFPLKKKKKLEMRVNKDQRSYLGLLILWFFSLLLLESECFFLLATSRTSVSWMVDMFTGSESSLQYGLLSWRKSSY